MPRELRYLPSAIQEIKQLSIEDQQEVRAIIDSLSDEPFPDDAVKLRGHEDFYRIRFGGGQFRLVYRVRPEKVIIERARTRDAVYRGL